MRVTGSKDNETSDEGFLGSVKASEESSEGVYDWYMTERLDEAGADRSEKDESKAAGGKPGQGGARPLSQSEKVESRKTAR